MKRSYLNEFLVLFSSGVAGICIYDFKLIGFITGAILLALISYFLVSKLKENTILEYLEKCRKAEKPILVKQEDYLSLLDIKESQKEGEE